MKHRGKMEHRLEIELPDIMDHRGKMEHWAQIEHQLAMEHPDKKSITKANAGAKWNTETKQIAERKMEHRSEMDHQVTWIVEA